MDAKEFKREDRYAVIKYKKLTDQQWTLVPTMLQNFEGSRVECVVIESDWPEYNFVWLMLEHRMAGFPVPDFNAVKCAADVAIAEQRLADAERRNESRNAEIAAQVESALRRSFNLGQVYWQQADSDSTSQQNKCDQTMETQAQHILNVLKSIESALNKPEEAKS